MAFSLRTWLAHSSEALKWSAVASHPQCGHFTISDQAGPAEPKSKYRASWPSILFQPVSHFAESAVDSG